MRSPFGYGGGLPLNTNQQRILIGIIVVIAILVFIDAPAQFIGRLIGLTLGFTIHEWAHAYMAVRLGDKTPLFQGRLTLDPRAHIDPIGIVMALVAGFGWAKPVPVNTRAFYPHERQGLMLVALAGPVSNVIIALIFGVFIRLFDVIIPWNGIGINHFFYSVLYTIVLFNLTLFFFNLIPLSPLDGWKIMLGLLPPDQAYRTARYENESMIALILLLVLGIMIPPGVIGILLFPPIQFLAGLFTGL